MSAPKGHVVVCHLVPIGKFSFGNERDLFAAAITCPLSLSSPGLISLHAHQMVDSCEGEVETLEGMARSDARGLFTKAVIKAPGCDIFGMQKKTSAAEAEDRRARIT